jgi:hypothetical protein
MRTRVETAMILAFTLPAIAGCDKTPRDRLQGKWLGESVENIHPTQVTRATGWVKGTAIDFHGSKVTVTIPAETPRSGSYKISKVEGDTLTVSFLRDEGGHDEARLRFVGDQSLRWDIGEGREVVLHKAKQN